MLEQNPSGTRSHHGPGKSYRPGGKGALGGEKGRPVKCVGPQEWLPGGVPPEGCRLMAMGGAAQLGVGGWADVHEDLDKTRSRERVCSGCSQVPAAARNAQRNQCNLTIFPVLGMEPRGILLLS